MVKSIAMFDWLKSVYYFKLSPELLVVRDVLNAKEFRDIPEIAVGNNTVLAIGKAAKNAGGQLHRPFAHPRSIVSDFVMASQLLKTATKQVVKNKWFSAAPDVILQIPRNPAGGYTQIELRALRELLIQVGAKSVLIWEGADLSDEQIKKHQLPTNGTIHPT